MKALIDQLNALGVSISLEGDQLSIAAPKGALTPELLAQVRDNKQRLIELLRNVGEQRDFPRIAPQPHLRHESFSLTDVQHAYWLGRSNYVELGGVSAHYYVELERDDLDYDRLGISLNKVIQRHDMLRGVISADGRQRILPEVPVYEIPLHDLRSMSETERQSTLEGLRKRISNHVLPTDTWPMFEIEAAYLKDGKIRLYVGFDMLIIDASSIFLFFEEWRHFYEDLAWSPASLQFSYRDYAEAEEAIKAHPAYLRARDYWMKRLDASTIPPAPQLPVMIKPAASQESRFTQRHEVLPAAAWKQLKAWARNIGVTPSAAIMTAFSEVLRFWSREPHFTLNLTLFNRLPIHQDVTRLIGDFTSTNLLAVHAYSGESFADRAQRLQKQLSEDLEHRAFSGMLVQRERARRAGVAPGAAMPVVFTSMLGVSDYGREQNPMEFFGEYVYGVTHTPQVWLEHLVYEQGEDLLIGWDAVEALFPAGMLDDMFAVYCGLLRRLAEDEHAWSQKNTLLSLPSWQISEREAANATAHDMPPQTLHGLIIAQADARPDTCAVISGGERITYRGLLDDAYRLAHQLRQQGVERGDIVVVSIRKSWQQIAAVLGVLCAGGAYLPIDPELPTSRQQRLARHQGVKAAVVASEAEDISEWAGDMTVIYFDAAVTKSSGQNLALPDPDVQPNDLAYVEFTSGSTGEPKGVMIEHRNALNTLLDVNRRFNICNGDRVLALAALDFDLSVFDIFGILGAGGTMVIPSAERVTDPGHWTELVERHSVSVLNSVPSLMQMWIEHMQADHARILKKPRVIFLSGERIPATLPARLRSVFDGVQVAALGGPTETSIWCACQSTETLSPEWDSVPYGKPLANQVLHVCNELLEPSPVWTTGEIYVGGTGVGRGYLDNPEQTQVRFIHHPETGERLYRSGDLGRYLPGGMIEILGREDKQVKLNGYRIELEEVAAAARKQPEIKEAVALVVSASMSDRKTLALYFVMEPGIEESDEWVDKLRESLWDLLPAYMVPHHFIQLDRLPLTVNGKLNYKALPVPGTEKRDTAIRPRNETEQKLFSVWSRTLGHSDFGIGDSFFELGGSSLEAAKAVVQLRDEFQLPKVSHQLLMQRMLKDPTIEALASFLEE